MSPGKCLSIVPMWPLLAIILLSIGAGILLLGCEKFYKALGIDVDRIVITVAQLSVVALIILDAIFAYSVMSNKLRIHNVHCMAEGCRGYRIKDADNICSCLLRSVCKVYNIIILSLNWLAIFVHRGDEPRRWMAGPGGGRGARERYVLGPACRAARRAWDGNGRRTRA